MSENQNAGTSSPRNLDEDEVPVSLPSFSMPTKSKLKSKKIDFDRGDSHDDLYRKPTFNDHARFGITKIILLTFAIFIFGTLLAWLAIAWFEARHGKYGVLTKPFFEYAQYVITSLIGVVSVATGFYFGKSKN